MLRVMSNVTVMPLEPSLPLGEVIYFMPSTPLICCSRGVVTGCFYGSSVRAVVESGNVYLGRREVGKLRDRESGNRHSARQNNQERADGSRKWAAG